MSGDVHLVEVGEVVANRYEVLGVLGSGASAEVFLATDKRDGKEVALKVLDVDVAGKQAEEFRSRFMREARVVDELVHDQIVKIHGFGLHGGELPFICLERLTGRNLHEEVVENGRMSIGRAARIISSALAPLGFAHEQGIIHRDLKPSNLHLIDPGTPRERIVLLDFGLAFVAQGSEGRLTRTGLINGTPQYLAPEYIQRQILTPALDVYQMGLVLAELVQGFPVVTDNNPFRCLVRHSKGHLTLPPVLMDSPLGQVVRQALTLDHERRFKDAAAFKQALDRKLTMIDSAVVLDSVSTVTTPKFPSSWAPESAVAIEWSDADDVALEDLVEMIDWEDLDSRVGIEPADLDHLDALPELDSLSGDTGDVEAGSAAPKIRLIELEDGDGGPRGKDEVGQKALDEAPIDEGIASIEAAEPEAEQTERVADEPPIGSVPLVVDPKPTLPAARMPKPEVATEAGDEGDAGGDESKMGQGRMLLWLALLALALGVAAFAASQLL